ncbi:MAG: glutathione S-transferase C-terminal domain-containing protein, partial [Proteobacteria bacterium]|nr:glutathione S-transferase C-terminal domain-containing protein [Pseudomonadota bacterium]
KFKTQLDCYKYSDRHVLTEIEYRDQALWFLQLLEHKLSVHQFLFGEQISMADMAIFPFIRQFAFVDKQWFDQAGYNSLLSWLDFHLNSELFQSIMLKHPVWQDY